MVLKNELKYVSMWKIFKFFEMLTLQYCFKNKQTKKELEHGHVLSQA